MTLLAGDLTTPERWLNWNATQLNPVPPIVGQLISSMTAVIYSKLNRARLYSQPFVRVFNGEGTSALVLPDWPVTNIEQVQIGSVLIRPALLPTVVNGTVNTTNSGVYGYRYVPWLGSLPGDPAVLEFANGVYWPGAQNVQVSYTAGYLIKGEIWTVPTSGANQDKVTVLQPQGIWCRDNGVVNTVTGVAMTSVTTPPASGQYQVGPDSTPGLYTFNDTDVQAGLTVAISYSFIPADLEEACNQMVSERYMYRSRVGEQMKVLGGQETVKYMRGGYPGQMFPDLPPEVNGLILPYVSVISPAMGADT